MGVPPVRVVISKLVKRFFKRLRPRLPPEVNRSKRELHAAWDRYGYGHSSCQDYVDKFYEASELEKEMTDKFKSDMKHYPGKVMSYIVPPLNPYLFKGRHCPPRHVYTMMPLKSKHKLKQEI